MTKQQLRKTFLQKRRQLAPAAINKLDDLLLIHFQQLPIPPIQNVFAYMAMGQYAETDTGLIMDYLAFKNPGLQVAYPVCNFENNTMQAVVADDATVFNTNRYGTPEPQSAIIMSPESIQLVLVPLLCFDLGGNRVGYGKGFYDKYLQQPHVDAWKIGLSYFPAVDKISDTHDFDVPLDYCVTPERYYAF